MAQKFISGSSAAAIAQSVESAVLSGRLAAGTALPTVRELAASLHVSPTTVAAAFKLLQARGLVSGLGRNGTRITWTPRPHPLSAPADVPDATIDLANGNPDPELLPPLDRALRSIDPASRMYNAPALLPALSTFVSSELQADAISSAHLTVAGGGLDAIERILIEQCRAGDRVGVEDPVFPALLDVLRVNGFVPVPMRIDGEGPLPGAIAEAVRARARAVIVTPRAQNPSGASLTASRARDIVQALSRDPDVLLIENDHGGPIAGAPLHTLCDGSRSRWAHVRSVSKYLGPDLRVAFIAGDELTIARVTGSLSVGTRWVSHLLQQIVLALWSDPSSGRRLAQAADVYRQRREAMLSALAARGIIAHGSSGLNVWVPVPGEAHTLHALLERGWAVMAGERFRLKSPPAIRVTTAALKPAEAGRFASDLAAVLAVRTGSIA